MPRNEILRLPLVIARTGLSKSKIYELIKEGKFPLPINLIGGVAKGWVGAEIDQWVECETERGMKERDGKAARTTAPGAA